MEIWEPPFAEPDDDYDLCEWVPCTRVAEKGAKYAMIYRCEHCGETFHPMIELD